METKMLKVKKYTNSVTDYGIYYSVESVFEEEDSPQNYVFENNFTSDGDSIRYKLISVTDNNKVIYDFIINLQDIKNLNSFSEQTLWAVNDEFAKQNKFKESVQVPALNLVNVFNHTYADRSGFAKEPFLETPFKIFVPSTEAAAEDIYILLVDNHPYSEDPENLTIKNVVNITGTTDIETITLTNPSVLVDNISVTSTTSSPVAGDDINLTITCSNPDVDYVYVNALVGTPNKAIVKLTNGTGNLLIKTDTLSSGDEVLIKFGYKYFTGVTRYTKVLG